MKALLLATAVLAVPAMAPASALADDGLADNLILNMRLRYENVDQDGLAETASALTLRTRFGF